MCYGVKITKDIWGNDHIRYPRGDRPVALVKARQVPMVLGFQSLNFPATGGLIGWMSRVRSVKNENCMVTCSCYIYIL